VSPFAFLGRDLPLMAEMVPKSALAALASSGVVLGLLGLLSASAVTSLAYVSAGTALLLLGGVAWGAKHLMGAIRTRDQRRLMQLLGGSGAAYILADEDGHIQWQNTAAATHFGSDLPCNLSAILSDMHAKPSGFVTRMHDLACATDSADHHLALHNTHRAYHVAKLGDAQFLWRIELENPSAPNAPLPKANPRVPTPLIQSDAAQPDDTQHLQTLPVGLAHINIEGQLIYVNDEARRLLGLRDAYLPRLSDILEGLGRPVAEWITDIAARRIARSTEVLRLKQNFSETYLKVTLTAPPFAGAGFIVVVFSDVTELKSLEAKFSQSQKMQAIGQLAGGVAHDFNNLLTAISGHCDLLLLRHDRSDLDFPDLMQIQQNTNRAAALVRQLLALSRQQTLKFETLDLHETIEDVTHLLNRLVGEKVTLTLRHGTAVAPIRSDKRQFEQILMNLVVNARDALPMGGEIRIETETRPLPQGLTRENVQLPPGTYTLIKISDDGVGIPQALIGKVFEPFFTTKRQGEGTGLGLSTVYGIVKQSGGYIFVDSEEGVGASFTLYFAAQKPAPPVPEMPRQNSMHSTALHLRHALILLVEDETPVRSFAARALELQGHKVLEADCGEAALDILTDHTIRPDCFVTDVIMPGLDGPSWIAEIRDRFPETPVIFMSGYAEDSRVAAQARISNATFLGKPFSLAEFTQTVNAQLRAPVEAA